MWERPVEVHAANVNRVKGECKLTLCLEDIERLPSGYRAGPYVAFQSQLIYLTRTFTYLQLLTILVLLSTAL
jgi:hypothetical protein